MGFSVINEIINERYTLVKFTFEEDFTKDDFNRFLGILSKLLDISDDTNKPFAFYVDAHKSSIAPMNAVKNLIAWKQKESKRIKENKKLKGSAVYLKNQTLISLFNSALKISPAITPNLITNNIESAKNFVLSALEQNS
jgi:hypothetical protein